MRGISHLDDMKREEEARIGVGGVDRNAAVGNDGQ